MTSFEIGAHEAETLREFLAIYFRVFSQHCAHYADRHQSGDELAEQILSLLGEGE